MAYQYDPDDKFGFKDTLPEGHPEKIIRGIEFDDEFRKIALDSQESSDALDAEIEARISGDENLQQQINDILSSGGGGGTSLGEAPLDGKQYGRQNAGWTEIVGGGVGGGASTWDELAGKPTEFPPEAHDHIIDNVTGLQDALDDKADADHTHEIADVNGLQDALNDAGGGGSPVHIGDTAPADPVEGQQWFNTDNGTLYIYYNNNGNPEWVSASGESSSGAPAVHVSDTAPADPVEGQQWLNTDDGYLYVYYDNAGNPTWMAVERQS